MEINNTKQKLELTWIGKGQELKLEPRILIEDPSKSYGDKNTDNMLIYGDNLLALKALEQDFAGKIKCIYIDPPFNTGNAFEHYDDSIEHSIWLNLMYSRFLLLKNLLTCDGLIFIHLDDEEVAYSKVILDEIFGRSNYINTITLTTNDPSGFKATSSSLFSTSNYILIYAKDAHVATINKVYIKKDYDNAYSKVLLNRNSDYSNWKWANIKEVVATYMGFKDYKTAKNKLLETFDKETVELVFEKNIELYAIKNAHTVFRTAAIGGGAKIKRQSTINKSKIDKDKVFVHPNEDINNFYILNGEQILFYENRLGIVEDELVPVQILTDVWTDISWTGIASEGNVVFKNGKKPERLIARCLELGSNEGDYILDSFAGSGTSMAVAHKMKRKWIGIELGDQAMTHCTPRLKRVVDGSDLSGIAKVYKWKGGGGFKFYNLAPSLLKKDKFGNWVIDERYNPNMLAAAMCKHMGFKYLPDSEVYWKQGQSTETDYIFTTTNFLTVAMLDTIKDEMKPDETLLICAKSFDPTCDIKYQNITIKKIPQSILGKCEFSKDNYDLNIIKHTEEIAEEQEETQE